MRDSAVFSRIVPALLPIDRKLVRSTSTLPANAVKKDFVVLFFMLHEHPSDMFSGNTFLESVRSFFQIGLPDMVALMEKVDIFIPASVNPNSSEKEVEDCRSSGHGCEVGPDDGHQPSRAFMDCGSRPQ